ncbi:hypothetical protein G3I51_24335 [Streptomyces sp. SID9944]|nr:hypothetical protein [Streptomyces sp. SID9944]
MPAYLIIHPREQRKDDILIQGDDLTLTFTAGWAVITDTHGPCLAIPAGQGAHIQRVDDTQEPAPGPGGE